MNPLPPVRHASASTARSYFLLASLVMVIAAAVSAPVSAQTTVPSAVPTTQTLPPPTTAPTTQAVRNERWVSAYEQRDRETPPPANPTLFVGSSTFTRWRDLALRFPEHTALNRAFGGATLADLITYADRIILAYKPKAVVIYSGTNDIAATASPEEVLRRFQTLTDKIHTVLPQTQIYFVSIIPAPRRASLASQIDAANALIREYADQHDHLHYIDARTIWSDPHGNPDPQQYDPDRLHPTTQAYDRLVPLIEPSLDQDG